MVTLFVDRSLIIEGLFFCFIARSKPALDKIGAKVIVFVLDNKEAFKDIEENINTLLRRMYIDGESLPMIIITEGRLNEIVLIKQI